MRTMPKSKKGGVVSTTVFGVGALIIAVIVTLLIIQTMDESAMITQFDTITVTNETGAWINETTYTVDNSAQRGFQTLTITSAIATADNSSIGTGNFTVSGAGFTNATVYTNDTIWVSYTYQRWSDEQLAIEDSTGNFTTGVDNVSSRLPTILLIVAVIFLLGALVLLVRMSGGMGINIAGSGGGSL